MEVLHALYRAKAKLFTSGHKEQENMGYLQ